MAKLEAQWLQVRRNRRRLHEATKQLQGEEDRRIARTTANGDRVHRGNMKDRM